MSLLKEKEPSYAQSPPRYATGYSNDHFKRFHIQLMKKAVGERRDKADEPATDDPAAVAKGA